MPVVARSSEYRERTEELERASLSSWATLALETKGRDRYEEPDPLRTAFQADRDRVASSDAWHALAGKVARIAEDRRRTRLREAVEVVAVARTLARALRLNEDLTEAIALGQPLGATPFAEAGAEGLELALDRAYRHEEQALAVVERIEGAGAGLNLTWEVRDGILHQAWDGPPAATLEGEAARFARRIVEISEMGARLDDKALAEGPWRGLQALGGSRAERVARATADVADRSLDRPELSLSPFVADCYAGIAAADARRREADPYVGNERARAFHCVASVAVFHLSGGAEPLSHHDTVSRVAGSTDAELIATYRSMYEPSGA